MHIKTTLLLLISMILLSSCWTSEQEDRLELNTVLESKIEVKEVVELEKIASEVDPWEKILYENLPLQTKEEIKQMMDVIVLYILKKGEPKTASWTLTPEQQKAYFDNELILWINEEILPAYPNVDFTQMKKLILLGE